MFDAAKFNWLTEYVIVSPEMPGVFFGTTRTMKEAVAAIEALSPIWKRQYPDMKTVAIMTMLPTLSTWKKL